MDDPTLADSLQRADLALGRVERALGAQAQSGRDDELRDKVREAVAELDQLIRAAGR